MFNNFHRLSPAPPLLLSPALRATRAARGGKALPPPQCTTRRRFRLRQAPRAGAWSVKSSGIAISKHAPFTRVVELDNEFAAVVPAVYNDFHFVIRLSIYKGEYGLPLINIKEVTVESPILQLNATRVACDELGILVD